MCRSELHILAQPTDGSFAGRLLNADADNCKPPSTTELRLLLVNWEHDNIKFPHSQLYQQPSLLIRKSTFIDL